MARITDACMAAQDRGGREHRHPEQEHTLAAEEVPESPGEEQEASERDEEGVDDPGEVALGEMELALDLGQGDVHDRRVEHDHELREADDDERQPATAVRGGGCRRESHRCPDV
jgi:hypothetical protein